MLKDVKSADGGVSLKWKLIGPIIVVVMLAGVWLEKTWLDSFWHNIETSAIQKGEALAGFGLRAFNSLMIGGTIDEVELREFLKNNFEAAEEIEKFRIYRGPKVIAQFNDSDNPVQDMEKFDAKDKLITNAFERKTTQHEFLENYEGKPALRIIFPALAEGDADPEDPVKNGKEPQCLFCHNENVVVGDALGAIEIVVSLERQVEEYQAVKQKTILISITILFSIFILVYVIVKLVLASLPKLVEMFEAIAKGYLTRTIEVKSRDEIGRLAVYLNEMSSGLKSIIVGIHTASNSVASDSGKLAGRSTLISSKMEEINSRSHDIASAAEQLSGSFNTIATSSAEVSESISAVAVAVEEMSASINEVSLSAKKEAQIVSDANQRAKTAHEIMSALLVSSHEIDKVVEVINKIAAQINLLALNATIEAASAGEAGKGFAVVANSVKELAKQTGSATEEISKRINDIKENTNDAANAIEEVFSIMEEVDALTNNIALAVEEQSSVSNEIAGSIEKSSHSANDITNNIMQAAESSSEVSENIRHVGTLVNDAARSSDEANKDTLGLEKSANNLQEVVAKFKTSNKKFDSTNIQNEHNRWKIMLNGMLIGEDKISAEEFPGEENCAFGKWLLTGEKDDLNQPSTLNEIIEWHNKFHMAGKEILTLANESEKQTTIDKYTQFRDVANKLNQLLNRLEEEVN
ncbi:hypothetical protein MNBD_NITROSPINAE02-849 [hydrothermal vent metagenome]|uniref:Methyl-accepting chemotaxis protein n=1 Tax=hydrothermal vent metagenome TaxID=652676 RepID=A0A3B1CCV5_9ZZZZ